MTVRSASLSILDVGQGDCIVLHDPECREAVLIDCPGGRGQLAVDFLRGLSLQSLRAVVVSHLHADHYGGIEESLESLVPEPEELWLSLAIAEGKTSPPAGRSVLKHLNRYGQRRDIDRSIPATGRSLSCTRMRLDVLAPDDHAQLQAVTLADPNWSSLIVLAELAGFRALLGADAPPAQWHRLLVSGVDLRADVLLVPHHGAEFDQTGLTTLLDAVSPSLIALSVGSLNRYEHPRTATLEALGDYARMSGARLLCTQLNRICAQKTPAADTTCAGTISVSSEAGRLRIATGTPHHPAFVAAQPAARCR